MLWDKELSNWVLSGGGISLGTGVTISTPAANVLAFSIDGAVNAKLNNYGAFIVGDGVDGEAWADAYKAVQVGSGGFIGQAPGASASSYWTNNAYFDSVNSRWEYIAADEASKLESTDGVLTWMTASAGSADGAITWSEKLRVDSSGNLGIGEDSPGAKLDVKTVGVAAIFNTGAANDGRIEFEYNSSRVGLLAYHSDRVEIQTDSSKAFTVRTGGANERLRITSAGLVGINTVPANNVPFSAWGEASAYGGQLQNFVIMDTTATTHGSGGAIALAGYSGTNSKQQIARASIKGGHDSYTLTNNAGNLQVYTRPAADYLTERIRVTSEGKVGIGLTNPTSFVQISKKGTSDGASFRLESGEGQSAEFTMYADEGDDNNDLWRVLASTDQTFRVGNYAAGSWIDAVWIHANAGGGAGTAGIGSVGLSGQNDPGHPLHIGAADLPIVGQGNYAGNEWNCVVGSNVSSSSGQAETVLGIAQMGSGNSSVVGLTAGVNGGTNPYFSIKCRENPSPYHVRERLRIITDGSVGIGTSVPTARFHVYDESGTNSKWGLVHENDANNAGNSQWIATYTEMGGYARLELNGGGLKQNDTEGNFSADHYLISYGSGSQYNGDLSLKNGTGSIWFASGGTDLASDLALWLDKSKKVGIGVSDLLAKFHVKNGDSGVTSVHANGDDMLIEGNDHTALTIASPNNKTCAVRFDDPDNSGRGRVQYSHTSDEMQIYTSSAQAVTITASGDLLVGQTIQYGSTGVGQTSFVFERGSNGISHGVITNQNNNANAAAALTLATYGQDWRMEAHSNSYSTNPAGMSLFKGTSEYIRVDNSGRLQINNSGVAWLNTATEDTPLYMAVATDITAVNTALGGATTGVFRIQDIGSNSNRYHGVEIRNRNSGDIRLLNKDVDDTNEADFVIAVDNGAASADLVERMIIDGDSTTTFKGPEDQCVVRLNNTGAATVGRLVFDNADASNQANMYRIDFWEGAWNNTDSANGFIKYDGSTGSGGDGAVIIGGNCSPGGANAAIADFARDRTTHCYGTLSKAGGSFRIAHPVAGLTTTTELIHSFIEGPQMDLIYRGKVTLSSGTASVNIDTNSNMTDGTFVALCREVQCFTSNETGWDAVKGSVSGNILTITSQNNSSTDTISWMVIGERKDDTIKLSSMTDNDGNLIVERPMTRDLVTGISTALQA